MGTSTVYLLVTTAAFFWGANFILAAPVLADLPPLWAAALRFLLGAGLMLAIAVLRREDLIALARRHAGAYLLLGTVGIVAFNLLFFSAMGGTSADNGALIMATNPLLTTLLAALWLKERPTTRQWAALPLALAGVAVVVAHGDVHRLLGLHLARGDSLMLAANLAWAGYNVLGKRYMPPASPLGNTALIMAVGAFLLSAVAFVGGGHLVLPGAKAGAALAIMAVGGTVLAYLFWSIGILRLGAGRTAIFLNLVPVSAMVLGAALGTPPTFVQGVGGALVLGGVTLAMLPTRRPAAA